MDTAPRFLLALLLVMTCVMACKTDPPPAPPAEPSVKAPLAKPTPEKAVDAGVEAKPEPKPVEVSADMRKLLAHEHARYVGGDDGLGAFVTHEDPKVRARAALALGRIGLADSVSPLLVLMDDDDPAVRADAAFGAAILQVALADDEKSSTDLRDGIRRAWKKEREDRKDPKVREAIAWALRRFGGEKSEGIVDLLRDAFHDGDPEVTATAMESFALLSRYSPKTPGAADEGFVRSIRLRAADTNPATRKAATYALMRMKIKDAIPDFKQALEKQRPDDERAMAIRALTALEAWEVGLMRDLLMPPPEPSMDNLEPVDYRGDIWTRIHAVNHLLAAKTEPALTVIEEWMNKEILPQLRDHGTGLDAPLFHAILAVANGLPKFEQKDRAKALLDTFYMASSRGGSLRREKASRGEDLGAAILHCASAAALDKLDGKVSRTTDCAAGLEAVYPATRRQVHLLNTQVGLAKKPVDKVRVLAKAYTGDTPMAVKVAIMVQAAQLFDGEGGPGLVKALGTKALNETDPVLRSYGVKLAARDGVLLGLLAQGAQKEPGENLDVVLEALDACKKHKPKGAAQAVKPWTGNPNHAVRARARGVLEELDPAASPIPWKPTIAEPRGVPGPPVKAVVRTTRGNIELELWPEHAPATVESFVSLARKGEFNGLTFHRVIAGFVSQGGDPRGDGHGGPGYTIPAEWTRLPYDAGTLGMAHAGKDTGGCQFFLTHRPHPHLDGGYTVFGRVTKGLDGVHTLQQGDIIRGIDIR